MQKFKNFRVAFRKFDMNFDGSINFREFMNGMAILGINFGLPDYRLVFDAIDYDGTKEINFVKFCLLDTEKREDRERLYNEYAEQRKKEKS